MGVAGALPPSGATSVDVLLPVGGDAPGWPRSRLVDGVVGRVGETRTGEHLLARVVPEPVLTGFEAPYHVVAGRAGVGGGVLAGRAVAAPDVAAGRAPTQMHPPAVGRGALGAAGSAGKGLRVEGGVIAHEGSVHR